jgi:hypothetical protein
MNQQIAPIHTPCKQCVFAQYLDTTQIGCHLEYIEIYKKNNIEILEAYDDNKEFFIINNKKCIGYRENKWFEKRDMANASIEQKIAKYEESNFAHYVAVINLKDLSLLDLEQIYHNLSSCTIKPQKIVMIRYINDEKNFPYKDIEKIFYKQESIIPWRIQTMLDNNIPYQHILCDIAKNNKFCRFLLDVSENNSKINDIINHVNNKVYKELKSFCVCTDQSKKILFYSSTILRHAYDSGKDIINDSELCEII